MMIKTAYGQNKSNSQDKSGTTIPRGARKRRPGGGRKSKVENISAADVKKLAAIGCTQQNIADFYGVHKSQISRNFATAYREGTESCKLTLRKWQMKAASKGSVDMLKWLGKQMLGQKEPKQEIAINEIPPIQVFLNDKGK